jgi:nicotinamidase/pyrazinamidase
MEEPDDRSVLDGGTVASALQSHGARPARQPIGSVARSTAIAYNHRRTRIATPTYEEAEERRPMTGTWKSPQSGTWDVADPEARYGADVALVIVDLQNDFADPAGSLSVRGGAEIVALVNVEVERALGAGAAVAYTQDWHPAHTPHFAQDGGIWPVHCVHDSWGAELHPDLSVRGPIVRKGTHGEDGYSGFSMRNPAGGLPVPTELDAKLARGGVKRLVICGLATDYCVKATALDGARLGYETAVLLDAIRAVDLKAGDGDRALDEIAEAGVTLVGTRSATS